MIPREFVEFVAIIAIVVSLVALAVAERERFFCLPGEPALWLGSVKLYGCE